MILLSDFFFIIISIGLAIRILPIILFKIESPDNYYHLTAAQQIWDEKKIPDYLKAFLLKGAYSYPPTLHLLLAPIVGRNKIFLSKIIGPIFDVLNAILIYFVVSEFFGQEIALVSCLIYIITPLNLMESLAVTPRPIGLFFTTSFFLLAFISIFSNSILFLIMASFCFMGVLLSHKMATQSIVSASIIISLFYILLDYQLSIFIMSALTLGFFLALVISRGFYRKIFRAHKAMLSYHFKQGNYEGKKQFGNPLEIIKRWPWLPILPFVYFISSLSLENNPHFIFLLIWGVFFLIITVLWRYGDNYRYLTYGIAPLSIIVSQTVWSFNDEIKFFFLAIIILLSLGRLSIFIRNQKRNRIISKDLLNCFEFIRTKKEYQAVGYVPVSLIYPAAFFTGKQVLGAEASPEPWEKGIDYSAYMENHELLLKLLKEFNIKTFLINLNDPRGRKLKSILEESKIIKSYLSFKEGTYQIYELTITKP